MPSEERERHSHADHYPGTIEGHRSYCYANIRMSCECESPKRHADRSEPHKPRCCCAALRREGVSQAIKRKCYAGGKHADADTDDEGLDRLKAHREGERRRTVEERYRCSDGQAEPDPACPFGCLADWSLPLMFVLFPHSCQYKGYPPASVRSGIMLLARLLWRCTGRKWRCTDGGKSNDEQLNGASCRFRSCADLQR